MDIREVLINKVNQGNGGPVYEVDLVTEYQTFLRKNNQPANKADGQRLLEEMVAEGLLKTDSIGSQKYYTNPHQIGSTEDVIIPISSSGEGLPVRDPKTELMAAISTAIDAYTAKVQQEPLNKIKETLKGLF